jgi:hypothetical protein
MVTAGASAAASTHCTVDNADPSGTWAASDAKYVVDWPNQTDIAQYTALNFAPADPLYFEYHVSEADGTGDCGHTPGETDTYVFSAHADLDGDTNLSTFELSAGTNPDNALYRAPGIFTADPLE